MGVTTAGLSVVATSLSGSALPTHMAIGIGSITFSSGLTALQTEKDRNLVDSYDTATTQQITLIANWDPVDISGIILREFGTMTTGSVMMNYEAITGSMVFDGEQELQIQQTFKIWM